MKKFTLFGQAEAINLEQLDVLLESLKTYWDYSNNKALLADIDANKHQPEKHDYQLVYEL